METSTRGSDPIERNNREIMACRLRSAGLRGEYASADCELGHRCHDLYEKGKGAYLYGDTGVGKTYAAACAARMVTEDWGDAMLMTVQQLLDGIKQSWDGGEDVGRESMRCDLLVLDDFGAERMSEWSKAELTSIIDARTSSGRPTIITSNYTLGKVRDAWGGIEGKRMASRIGGACERIHVYGQDRRLS